MPLSTTRRRGLATLLVAGLAAACMTPAASAVAPTTAPARAAASASAHPAAVLAPNAALAPAGCVRTSSPVVCDLYARAGAVALPGVGGTTTFWSYTSDATSPVQPVGPTLVVTQGDVVSLVLHNQLGEATSLSLPQVETFPDDTTGAAPAATKPYLFTASRPGTFVYEAGATVGGSRQVALGMVGVLVVLPTTAGTAYGTPSTAYDDEGVVLLTDVDPGLNASPATFDMRNFSSRVRLMNGRAFPDTQHIATVPGHTLLLRVVNGSIVQHSFGLLGLGLGVVATSSRLLAQGYQVAGETVPAGDTLDSVVAIPATGGPLYPLYDTSTRLDNNGALTSGQVGFGGALTFIEAGTGTPAPAGPTVSGLTLTPTASGGTGSMTFSATVTSVDGAPITAVEYTLDNAGFAPGSGTQLTGGASPLTLTGISVPLASLATGTHSLLVRGRVGTATWGALAAVTFVVDRTGPSVTALTTTPTATNGTAAVTLSGTASDIAYGASRVTSVSYAVDGVSAGTATLTPATGVTVGLSGSIPVSAILALADGRHVVTATATDEWGNTGPAGPAGVPAGTPFVLDRAGPASSNVVVTPSPNDGTQGVSYDPTSVEVRSTVTDPPAPDGTRSGVVGGEAFIDTVGATGTGFPLAYYTAGGVSQLLGTFPVSELTKYGAGTHQVLVRGRDAAGNWGVTAAGSLVIDRAGRIFADAFTGPSLVPPWSAVVRSSGTAVLANVGGNQALAATLSSPTGTAYVVDTTPAAEAAYKIAFQLTPNTLVTGGRVLTIFQARTATGQAFRIEYRTTSGGATRSVRIVVTRANGTTTGSYITLPGAGPVTLHVSWLSGTSVTTLFTVGSTIQSLSGLNTSAQKVETAWLGLSGASGNGTVSGTAYFDNFVSNRLLAP